MGARNMSCKEQNPALLVLMGSLVWEELAGIKPIGLNFLIWRRINNIQVKTFQFETLKEDMGEGIIFPPLPTEDSLIHRHDQNTKTQMRSYFPFIHLPALLHSG